MSECINGECECSMCIDVNFKQLFLLKIYFIIMLCPDKKKDMEITEAHFFIAVNISCKNTQFHCPL